ncbi:MAG: tetratricopeptide repeat protein, partial [Bryobacterales bacterium]|nr:tetratricopeptide repeat protein [Bryobacterales bacterium]
RLTRGDYHGGAEAFDACLRKKNNWPEALVNLGLSYWKIGDRDSARRSYEQALESNAESVDALRGLAALAIERNDFEQALDYQARLIDQGERSPELFYNTGLLLQKSGQVEDAIRLYKEALTERPNFAEALLNLGHALKSKGQQEEARTYWKQALDAKPELAQGYFEPAHN